MKIVTPKEVHNLVIEKGFYDGTTERSVPELLCLSHSEISEALEAYRHNIPYGEKGWLGEELADAVIRIWDMVEYLKIDIAKEINKKHKYNKTREYRHGGKKC
jgi:NTP pyrophosphatase (non-canonical NTP hydrolase)